MWCIILVIELLLAKGLLGMLFHKYNPVNISSVTWTAVFLLTGALLLAGSYYCYHVQKIQLACGIAGLPLLGIIVYFLVFLIVPYLMGERMN